MNYYEVVFTTLATEDYQQDLLINCEIVATCQRFEYSALLKCSDFHSILVRQAYPKRAALTDFARCSDGTAVSVDYRFTNR